MLTSDLRYTVRLLCKTPVFTLTAVLTVALGIGAVTAVFSVVHAVLIRPLPFAEPHALLAISEKHLTAPGLDRLSFGTARDFLRRSRLLERISLYQDGAGGRLVENGEVQIIRGQRVSPDFFRTLGIRPQLGRVFVPDDGLPGGNNVIVLSHALWTDRFGGDPAIIGRLLDISANRQVRVIGVLPGSFHPMHMSNPGELPQVFQPLGIEELESDDRASGGSAIARLKPSVTPAQLQSELDSILRQIAREHPADYPHDVEVVVQLLEEKLTSKVRRPLLVLSAAVSFLLLITCANVANLLLTRSIARSTEMALRSALGSGQWRLARLVLTESMVVAAIGGLAGIGLAYAGVRALLAYAPPEVPRLAEVRIDASVLLFAAAVILFSGVIFGALPALRIGRIDLNETLRAGHVGEREWSRARRTLAVVEIAAAFVLATGTGLLLRSLDKLLHVEAGYDSHDILTMAVFLKDYSSERAGPNWRAIIERVRAVPGIENAAMVSTVPLSQPVQNSLEVEHGDITRVADLPIVDQYYASPEYLRVMRIRLMRGRFFDENDRLGSAPVAVVSESCARLNFPGGDPVGRRIRMGDRDGDGSRDWMTVVGIAGDVRQHGMDAGPGVGVYLPQSQHPNFYYRLVARTASNPWRYYPAVRSALRELDPMQPMFHVQPMDDYVIKSLADRIFALSLMGLLGSVALVLGGVGIYGVLSYTVSLRGHEIGVRMALGADSSAVYRLIGKDVLLMLAGGLAAGGVATMVCNRLIVHLLYGVDSTDPIATFGSACVLSVVSLAAAFVPCRRAVNIDPARTLHEA